MSNETIPPVSAIADVLSLWGRDGWLTPPLRPVAAAARPTLGRVRTVTIEAAQSGPGLTSIYDVLSDDLSGRFVVVSGATPVGGAVWGEILLLAARQSGAFGVLVDGAVRDRPAMEAVGLPIYASDQRVVGPQGLAHVVAIDAYIAIDDIGIDPSDHVVVDETGCVRVRHDELGEVLDAAAKYAAAEDLVLLALREGEPITSAYQYKKSIVDDLKRSAGSSGRQGAT